MIVLDTGIVSNLMKRDLASTGHRGELSPDDLKRVDHLLAECDRQRESICIPAPVLAEVLVLAPDPASIALVHRNVMSIRHVIVHPFGPLEAVINARAEWRAHASGNKRAPWNPSEPWTRVKVDRQVLAIASAKNARVVYTSDRDLLTAGRDWFNLNVVLVHDVPLPPSQGVLPGVPIPP